MEEERLQLYEWIPALFNEKKSELSLDQLRLLHFLLGYEATPQQGLEMFEEALQQYGVDEDVIESILLIVKRDGYVVLATPYPIFF